MRLALVATLAALYTAAGGFANPARADLAAARAAAQTGDMRKLVFHGTPQPVPQAELLTLDDQPRSLAEWQGQWVVVNFWATWCAPCREEMPTLDRLAAGGVPVVTVATGRNPPAAITRFWQETGIAHLPALRDPKSGLGRAMGIFGLPVTVILSPEGREVARLTGDARWDTPEAMAVIAALRAP
jgi:thiol-disulfide isomerase/thioredoxin